MNKRKRSKETKRVTFRIDEEDMVTVGDEGSRQLAALSARDRSILLKKQAQIDTEIIRQKAELQLLELFQTTSGKYTNECSKEDSLEDNLRREEEELDESLRQVNLEIETLCQGSHAKVTPEETLSEWMPFNTSANEPTENCDAECPRSSFQNGGLRSIGVEQVIENIPFSPDEPYSFNLNKSFPESDFMTNGSVSSTPKIRDNNLNNSIESRHYGNYSYKDSSVTEGLSSNNVLDNIERINNLAINIVNGTKYFENLYSRENCKSIVTENLSRIRKQVNKDNLMDETSPQINIDVVETIHPSVCPINSLGESDMTQSHSNNEPHFKNGFHNPMLNGEMSCQYMGADSMSDGYSSDPEPTQITIDGLLQSFSYLEEDLDLQLEQLETEEDDHMEKIRQIGRRAREEHRRNAGLHSDQSHESRHGHGRIRGIVSKPISREAIINWFRSNEAPKEVGLDMRTGRLSPWFHGMISRREAEELLKYRPIGTYLVRLSEKIWGYAISYKDAAKIKHFLVEVHCGQYTLFGSDLPKYNSLKDLIDAYKQSPITSSGLELLLYPCTPDYDSSIYVELFESVDYAGTSL